MRSCDVFQSVHLNNTDRSKSSGGCVCSVHNCISLFTLQSDLYKIRLQATIISSAQSWDSQKNRASVLNKSSDAYLLTVPTKDRSRVSS